MWERIQNLSRVLFLPAIVLYFCGFICLTGYYARFGIITFEILNIRFLAAGFLVVLPVALCVWSAWKLYRDFDAIALPYYEALPDRLGIYIGTLSIPFGAASAFNLFWDVSDFSKESDPAKFKFTDMFWGHDPLGRLLGRLDVFGHNGWSFVFNSTVEIFVFFSIIVVVFFPIRSLLRNLIPKKGNGIRAEMVPKVAVSKDLGDRPFEVLSTAPPSLKISGFRGSIIAIDIFFLSLILAFAIFSYLKVRSQILDAGLLGRTGWTLSLIFSWFYGTILSVFIFLLAPVTFSRNNGVQLEFESIRRFIDPTVLPEVLQRLLVPILGSIFLFGMTIFPRLPFAIGGGQPREVVLEGEKSEPSFSAGKWYLIGESSQFFFLVNVNSNLPSAAYQINKQDIRSVQTWRASSSAPNSISVAHNMPAKKAEVTSPTLSKNPASHWAD